MGLLGQAWRSASRRVRWGFITMWAAGAALTGAGVYGDLDHIWESMPFTTNLASGLAAFLLGAPTAVLVLQGVSRHIASRVEREHLRGLLSRDLEALRIPITELQVAAGIRPRWGKPDAVEPRPSTFTLFSEIGRLSANARSIDDVRLMKEVRQFVERWNHDRVIASICRIAPDVHRRALGLRDDLRPRFIQADMEWPLETVLPDLIEASRSVPMLSLEPTTNPSALPASAHIRRVPVGNLDPDTMMRRLEATLLQMRQFIAALRQVTGYGASYLREPSMWIEIEAPDQEFVIPPPRPIFG